MKTQLVGMLLGIALYLTSQGLASAQIDTPKTCTEATCVCTLSKALLPVDELPEGQPGVTAVASFDLTPSRPSHGCCQYTPLQNCTADPIDCKYRLILSAQTDDGSDQNWEITGHGVTTPYSGVASVAESFPPSGSSESVVSLECGDRKRYRIKMNGFTVLRPVIDCFDCPASS